MGGSKSVANTESGTLTNTGTGLNASRVGGNVTYVTNDPGAAIAALQANAYNVDRALTTVEKTSKGANDLSALTITNSLDTVSKTVSAATGLLSQTQELYYGKLADNAGVAPQTLQQQSQAASADLTKLILLAVAGIAVVYFITKSSK